MGPGRAGCLGLLLAAAVVRATSAVSTADPDSMRSPLPGDNCSPYYTNDVFSESEVVDITVSRQTLPFVVDIWLNTQVRIQVSTVLVALCIFNC